ncbi:MAG: NUDIX domain-containing protein [Anaerolineales bacterium]|jgi:8-oxo-dGTP pyrophosphatase MutT (NUDIX family)
MKPIRNSAKAIIIHDGHILAVKYADQSGEYYALPGGGQLHGETLPQALVREIREELDITVNNFSLRFIREYIGVFQESSWRDADIHQVEFLYECVLEAGQEPRLGKHGDYSMVDIVWLPIRLISSYRFYPKRLVSYLGNALPNAIEYWGNVE